MTSGMSERMQKKAPERDGACETFLQLRHCLKRLFCLGHFNLLQILLCESILQLRYRLQRWIELYERSVHCAVVLVAAIAVRSRRSHLPCLPAVEAEEGPLAWEPRVISHVYRDSHDVALKVAVLIDRGATARSSCF